MDVGANAGTTAIPLAQRGFRVLAIEPVPRTLAYLLENVRDNGLDGLVTGVQAAISRPGPRVDMVLGGGLGQSEVRLSSDQETLVDSQYRVTASVSVPAAGLSEILDDHAVATNEVAFVWCDTQGSETEVIASGTELWSSGVPLYAELWPAASPAGRARGLLRCGRIELFRISSSGIALSQPSKASPSPYRS